MMEAPEQQRCWPTNFKKKQQKKETVVQLNEENTKVLISGQDEIANQFAIYYQDLYDAAQNHVNNDKLTRFFQKLNLSKATEEQNISLTKEILEEEIYNHINKLKIHKSPGSDGYTNEFYKEFQHDLVPLLCKAYNWALDNETWATTWNSAIITVLYKPGKNPTDCSSYRPISLLSTDHKLLSSILATRLAKIIPQLINPDQTGFIS